MDLKGKRILITRPAGQAEDFADLLRSHGAIPIYAPAIQISLHPDTTALDRALCELERYDWLVLTSVNGVRLVWERLEGLQIGALPAALKVAAIGPKTAAALHQQGVEPDFVPDEYIAEAILPGLGDVQGKRVLLLRADIARPALPQALRQAGGLAEEIAVYQTTPAQLNPKTVEALSQGVDMLTFTSSSTVRNFIRLVQDAGLDPRALPGSPRVACIGPVTAQTAQEEGYTVDLVANEYTIEGLVQALLDFNPRS